jgi:hypothetical protein
MDGKELKYQVQMLLGEEFDSEFLDEKTLYSFINEAALIINRNVNALTSSQSITTVADQTDYTLNVDFLKPYLMDTSKRIVIKYSDGTTTYFLPMEEHIKIIYDNNTSSVSIPSVFAITDDRTLDTQVSGTASANGALDANSKEATLTDTGDPFGDVSAGDVVHNTTDSSSGIVLEKTDSNNLITAMFPDDSSATTDQDWDSSDAYIIQPQGRLKLVIDPPPSTAGHTITIDYVQKPVPVYANYRTFRFQPHINNAVVKYAAWLFKYSDREPNFGDKWFVLADNEMRRAKHGIDNAFNRKGIPLNLKARR